MQMVQGKSLLAISHLRAQVTVAADPGRSKACCDMSGAIPYVLMLHP